MTQSTTFIILTYNRANLLVRAVESALNQTLPFSKIIVSDNSSTASQRLLNKKALKTLLAQNHGKLFLKPRPQSLRADHHFAYIQEHYVGVDGYTVLFHDDDELDPRYHQTLAGELERNPTYAAVACNARKVIDNRLVKGSVMRSTTGDSVLLDPTDLIKRYFDISPIGPPPLCSYMIRSAIMKNLSFGWEFGGKYSDVLALASVVRQGPVKWLHEPLVRYRIHSGQDSRSTSIRNYRKLVRQIVTQGFLPADSPLLDVYRFKHFRLQVKNMQKPENHKRLQVVRRFMFAFVVNRLVTKRDIWHFMTRKLLRW